MSTVSVSDHARYQFRDAMSRLGAAVNIVTSNGPAGKLGFTASAICSVSDSPPTLLVCMNRSSAQNEPLKRNGVLCVNSLSSAHKDLSAVFAGLGQMDMPSRFEQAEWSELTSGSPVLKDAVVSFDCRIGSVLEVATHSIIFGEVLSVNIGEGSAGLMYFGRTYHDLKMETSG